MHLFATKNSNAVKLIKDFLIEDRDLDRDSIASMLEEFLDRGAEKCQFLLLIDEEEVVGFSFSYIPCLRDHLYIYQVYLDKRTAKTRWPQYLFSKIQAFAERQDLSEIRMETRRSSEAFTRRWGFTPLSTIMSYDLTEEEEEASSESEDESWH